MWRYGVSCGLCKLLSPTVADEHGLDRIRLIKSLCVLLRHCVLQFPPHTPAPAPSLLRPSFVMQQRLPLRPPCCALLYNTSSARKLTDEQRSAVASYFAVYKGYENDKAKLMLGANGTILHPAVQQAAEVLRQHWEEVSNFLSLSSPCVALRCLPLADNPAAAAGNGKRGHEDHDAKAHP